MGNRNHVGWCALGLNIREDFPVESLEKRLMAIAEGRGSSIMTISCANLETYE